jgi:hypothetical protein
MGRFALGARTRLNFVVTKTENRAAGRAWAAEKERRFREEQERAARAADLEALRVFRDYLIFKAKTRGDAYERLKIAVDEYAAN